VVGREETERIDADVENIAVERVDEVFAVRLFVGAAVALAADGDERERQVDAVRTDGVSPPRSRYRRGVPPWWHGFRTS
jgi:hypothetical protein